MTIGIEVTFLTGRYVATSYHSRDASEWPPHPARLYSALVATHFAEEPPDPHERAALLWLEAQPLPGIHALDASDRTPYTVFVPVNDSSVLPDFSEQTGAAEEASTRVACLAARLQSDGLPPAEKKTLQRELVRLERTARKCREKLAGAIGKGTAVPAGAGKGPVATARSLLPEFRVRQPRTFPSRTPDDPRVTFIWSDASPPQDVRERLDSLLARLVRLGHSSSMVSARLVDQPPEPTLVPGGAGPRLRVVGPGQLEALERAFARHQELEPRVMPARFQTYGKPGETTGRVPNGSCFSRDWILLARVSGPVLPSAGCVGISKMVRRVLMSYCKEPIPALLSGHRSDGSPLEGDHLAIVPLPFVGATHATGSVLGVALVFPRSTKDSDRKEAYQAILTWERHARTQPGNDRLEVRMGSLGVWGLQRSDVTEVRTNLQPETWCRPSRAWVSVTPVALDRHPGDLASRNPIRVAAAVKSANETIRRACVRIGLPPPECVEITQGPLLAGAPTVREVPPYAPGQVRRCLVHVRLAFPDEVDGPVLLGAGRYHGLGLFRPDGGS